MCHDDNSTSKPPEDSEQPEENKLNEEGKKATKSDKEHAKIPDKGDEDKEKKVQEALEGTFPATDPPGYTPEHT